MKKIILFLFFVAFSAQQAHACNWYHFVCLPEFNRAEIRKIHVSECFDAFNAPQGSKAADIIESMAKRDIQVIGHHDFEPVSKTCHTNIGRTIRVDAENVYHPAKKTDGRDFPGLVFRITLYDDGMPILKDVELANFPQYGFNVNAFQYEVVQTDDMTDGDVSAYLFVHADDYEFLLDRQFSISSEKGELVLNDGRVIRDKQGKVFPITNKDMISYMKNMQKFQREMN